MASEQLKPEGGNVPFVKGQAGSAASFDGKTNLNTGINTPLDIDDPFTALRLDLLRRHS